MKKEVKENGGDEDNELIQLNENPWDSVVSMNHFTDSVLTKTDATNTNKLDEQKKALDESQKKAKASEEATKKAIQEARDELLKPEKID